MSPESLRACGKSTDLTQNPNEPSLLWNGMITPLLNTHIRGALWYQGESNAGNPQQYRCLFSSMIFDWRAKWRYSLEFMFVQLAAFAASPFMEIRLAQTAALRLPNVGMATAVDLGDPESPFHPIHPRNKREIGERLEFYASKFVYNHNVDWTGPLFSSFTWNRNGTDINVNVKFTEAVDGMKLRGTAFCRTCCTQGSPFEILDQNGAAIFAPVISFGSNEINLRFALAANRTPTHLRYLWSAYPECVLAGIRNDIPAPPFHTAIPN